MAPRGKGQNTKGPQQIVLVSDPADGFVEGEIVGEDETCFKVKLTTSAGRAVTQDVRKEDVMRAAAEAMQGRGVRDNTQLTHLNEGSLLMNLKTRYAQDEIYTYTAFILLAVNPYRPLPIYGEDIMEKYTGRRIGAADPHPFAIAERAYRLMKREAASQAIIISGESGAGKTETCKHVMKYLAHVGRAKNTDDLGRRLLESNPMLEAFGNAKTLRNNNSSRFGKFMKVNFGLSGEVLGAEVSTYLLERSRLVQQDVGERNYHVFYQMLAGLSAEEKERLKLGAAEDYAFLTSGNCCAINGVDDAADFEATRRSMTQVGIAEEEQQSIIRCLAAILHIGNVTFTEDNDGAAATTKDDHLAMAAELLGFELQRLEKALATRTIVDAAKRSPNSRKDFTKPLTVAEAVDARNSLTKALYQRLFELLVSRVNAGLKTAGDVRASIGVLDIFGFEAFERNSFEQLCINYANEKLQAHFNAEVFEQEQELYRAEALRWGEVQHKSNADCIEAIEKAVLPVLEDAVNPNIRMSPDDVAEFVHKRAEKLVAAGKEARLVPARGVPRRRGFAVRHFAGEVAYETAAMVDKNRDSLHGDLAALLAASSWPFLASVLVPGMASAAAPQQSTNGGKGGAPGPSPPATPGPKGGAKDKGAGRGGSVASKFSSQLNALLVELRAMSAHFIRCVKPNGEQKPRAFDGALVRAQLAASGMNEAVKLLNAGYPTRTPYDVLYARFAQATPDVVKRLAPPRFAEALLFGLEVPKDCFQLGLTRAFFRADALARLDELLGDDYKMAPEQAERIRRWYIRRCWWRARVAATYSRQMVRWLQRSRFERRALRAALVVVRIARWARAVRRRIAARRVYNALRTWQHRRHFVLARRGVRRLQAVVRGAAARKVHGPAVRAAIEALRKRIAEQRDAASREEARRLREAAIERRAEQQRQEAARADEARRRAEAEKLRAEEERAREEEARRQAAEERKRAEERRVRAAIEAEVATVRAELEAKLATTRAANPERDAEVDARIAELEGRLEAARSAAEGAMADLREGLRAAREASEAAAAAAEMARTEAEAAAAEVAAGREAAERAAREALERLEGHSRELTAAGERAAQLEASVRGAREEAGAARAAAEEAREESEALGESLESLEAAAASASSGAKAAAAAASALEARAASLEARTAAAEEAASKAAAAAALESRAAAAEAGAKALEARAAAAEAAAEAARSAAAAAMAAAERAEAEGRRAALEVGARLDRELAAVREELAALVAARRSSAAASSARDAVEAAEEAARKAAASAAEAIERAEATAKAQAGEAEARLQRELEALREEMAVLVAARRSDAAREAAAKAKAAAEAPARDVVEELEEKMHEAYSAADRRVAALEAGQASLARRAASLEKAELERRVAAIEAEAAARVKEEQAARQAAEAALAAIAAEWREFKAAAEREKGGKARRSLGPIDANAAPAPAPAPEASPEKPAAQPRQTARGCGGGVARTPSKLAAPARDAENVPQRAAPHTPGPVIVTEVPRARTVIEHSNVLEEVESAAAALARWAEEARLGSRPCIDPNCDEVQRIAEATAVLLRHGLRPARRGVREEPRCPWDVLEAYEREFRRLAEESGKAAEDDPIVQCFKIINNAMPAVGVLGRNGLMERLNMLVNILLDEGRLLEALQRLWGCGPVVRDLFEPTALLRDVTARARLTRALRPLEGHAFAMDYEIAMRPSTARASTVAPGHGAPQASQRSIVVV